MSGSGNNSRFTAPNQTTEQRLSTNVVGLVELSDFRKRRAAVLEQQEREAREAAKAGSTEDASDGNGGTGSATPDAGRDSPAGTGDAAAGTGGSEAEGGPAKKKTKTKDGKSKKKKGGKTSKLSFLEDDEGDDEDGHGDDDVDHKKSKASAKDSTSSSLSPSPSSTSDLPPIKSFTQQALRRQAAEREALRKEFLALQAAVKASEVAIPFVFYEGANIPGGTVRVKKGDHVWLFLDRSRKVGARLGVGEKRLSKARLHWARINVDDLMLVRGNLIIPHHYDFYFFVINKTLGPGGERVFNYTNEAPTTAAPMAPLTTPRNSVKKDGGGDGEAAAAAEDEDFSHLEGADDDPGLTKVVDRRWYERNKHIFPASLWQEFDPEEDYVHQVRRDQGGNAFFFTPK
ncbi:protein FAM50 [Sporothrix brasiliensis 5110]|uniref:Protein FAM50 n=1 Tax=Sporothrix brasiliensis 5110 TaxID=1398154 RepID=A0A0C2F1B3_9PEZI|nr:protein FAM50 [Sporothrix brasiliensis 5110]KIH92664.1 protein FAM50 [Sporothrix brasiliensis 5110]